MKYIGKAEFNTCNGLRLTAHVMVSSLLLPPPPPTSEGATLGAETHRQINKPNNKIQRLYTSFLVELSFTTEIVIFFPHYKRRTAHETHLIITMPQSCCNNLLYCQDENLSSAMGSGPVSFSKG